MQEQVCDLFLQELTVLGISPMSKKNDIQPLLPPRGKSLSPAHWLIPQKKIQQQPQRKQRIDFSNWKGKKENKASPLL